VAIDVTGYGGLVAAWLLGGAGGYGVAVYQARVTARSERDQRQRDAAKALQPLIAQFAKLVDRINLAAARGEEWEPAIGLVDPGSEIRILIDRLRDPTLRADLMRMLGLAAKVFVLLFMRSTAEGTGNAQFVFVGPVEFDFLGPGGRENPEIGPAATQNLVSELYDLQYDLHRRLGEMFH
jgi:hypothetical protein